MASEEAFGVLSSRMVRWGRRGGSRLLLVATFIGLAVAFGAVTPRASAASGVERGARALSPEAMAARAHGRIVANLVRIVSPRRDALTRNGHLRIVVRAPARARTFTVLVDGHTVSHEFRRRGRRGRRRAATIGGLRPGPHSLFVGVVDRRGRQGFDRREFISGRHVPGLLRLGRIAAHDPAAPIRVRFRAAARPLAVIAWLNGKRIDRAFGRTTHRVVSTTLSATHGLHPGLNKLTLIAYRRNGSYDVKRRRLVIARGAPLAGAGMDRIGHVGRVLRLDGRSSAPSEGSATRASSSALSYRWRLTARPPGSHAVLRGATRARPTLVPDVPGRYRASLVVTERRSGAHAADAAAVVPSAPDSVTLDVSPAWGPIGGAIDTDAAEGSGISIGGQSQQRGTGTVQVVVLARASTSQYAAGTVVSDNTYSGDASGMSALQSALSNLADTTTTNAGPYDYLVVVAGSSPGAGQPPVQPSAYPTFADAVGQIGVQLCSGNSAAPPPCLPQSSVTGAGGSFSIIGVPASGSASAWVAPGDLTGWLQVDQSGSAYTFVPPDNIPFRTSTGPTQASVSLSGQTYTSASLPAGSFGLLVAAFNPYTLAPLLGGPATFPLSGGATDLTFAAKALASVANGPPALVVIQSIGNIVPGQGGAGTTVWGEIAQDIEALGGSADVFLRLNGHEAYGLVGGNDVEGGQGAETTGSIPVSPSDFQVQGGPGIPGTVHGMLSRDLDWRFAPHTVDPTNLTDYTLLSVAEDPPVNWPYSDPAHRAANAWIAQTIDSDVNLGLCAGVPAGQLCDIRQAYVQDWEQFDDPSTVLEPLQHVSCPQQGGTVLNVPFTYQDCTDMVSEFTKEWPIVAQVRSYLGEPNGGATLQGPLGLSLGTMSATLSSVTGSLDNSLNTQENLSPAVPEGFQLFGDIFNIGSSILGGTDLDADAAITGVMGGLGNLAGDSVTGSDGSNALVSAVNAKANVLIDQALQDFTYASFNYSHIADLIVSDWRKLQFAAQVSDTWTPLDTTEFDAIKSQIQASTLQWFYRGLLPTFARTWNITDNSNPSQVTCDEVGEKWHPFEGTPAIGTYQYADNADLDIKPPNITGNWWVLGLTAPSQSKANGASTLPSGLTTSLLAPFNPDFSFTTAAQYPEVGFYPPWLMRWTLGPAQTFSRPDCFG